MTSFKWPVRVYYEDTDAGGVVYYANYLKFFERARTELLRSLGVEQDLLIREQQLVFVVRAVQVDYLLPARFNESLEITADISQLKKVSVDFQQQVIRGDTTLCKANIRIACLHCETMKPKQIPTFLLQKLNHD